MNLDNVHWYLPKISLRTSALILFGLLLAAQLTYLATPKLTEISDVPSLETTVPKQFGDWREIPSPYLQVSLTTGTDTSMDQPYDQVVTRTYVNGGGQQIMLALAWGKRQRQEVKIHRPDLCYIAQGFKVGSIKSVSFDGIPSKGQQVIGKHMIANTAGASEAVAYWMRIGVLFSEDAFDTRLYILKEGMSGRIPDGVLVRASIRLKAADQEQMAWPLLNSFLVEMSKSVPRETRLLLLGSGD